MNRRRVDTVREKNTTAEWLERRNRERAEASRRALLQRQIPAGFAPLRIPTLAEELTAALDEHKELPEPQLDPNFRALPVSRIQPAPPARRLRVLEDVPHGTPRSYSRGCRCELCREANAKAYLAWKVRARLNVPDHVHGTANGYHNYGCRCDLCKVAWRRKPRTQEASA